MTNETRIARLERQVRNFKIIVAGDGNIQGGFGELKPSGDTGERIANLEQATRKFSLDGNNIQIAGSFDTGFIVT